jgi:RNA polymerase sigma-70 factor (ECF subfamily)
MSELRRGPPIGCIKSGKLASASPLCDAAKHQDPTRFGLAYDRYAPTLYGLLLRILRDADDAQEVLQETFLTAWSSAASYDPSRGNELAWLITMARSRGIDRLRAKARRGQREQEAGAEISRDRQNVVPSGDQVMAFGQIRLAVRKAMSALPDAQRTALELAYFEGLSQSEIAARLGEPLGTIKTRIQLAMKKLRESLAAFRTR